MRYRPFDENGDMVPVQSSSQMWQGSKAVSGAIQSRLDLAHGDWWEDLTLGFRVPSLLVAGLRSSSMAVQLFSNYIAAYIRATEGVSRLGEATVTLDGRELRGDYSVITEFGDTAEGSVTTIELLNATTWRGGD